MLVATTSLREDQNSPNPVDPGTPEAKQYSNSAFALGRLKCPEGNSALDGTLTHSLTKTPHAAASGGDSKPIDSKVSDAKAPNVTVSEATVSNAKDLDAKGSDAKCLDVMTRIFGLDNGDGNSGCSISIGGGGEVARTVGGELDEEFRWKELFADIGQRNETPAFLVYKSMPRDHLLEAQMEQFLETYIRRYLSPIRQRELEHRIRRRLSEIDSQSVGLLEEVLKAMSPDITNDKFQIWWTRCGFSPSVVRMLAVRHNIDPDQSIEQLGPLLLHAVHPKFTHNINVGPIGASGAFWHPDIGPTGLRGQAGAHDGNHTGLTMSVASTGTTGPCAYHHGSCIRLPQFSLTEPVPPLSEQD